MGGRLGCPSVLVVGRRPVDPKHYINCPQFFNVFSKGACMLVAPSFAAFERLRRRSANCCKDIPPVLGELHPFAATETFALYLFRTVKLRH